jgi:hypothetical protein
VIGYDAVEKLYPDFWQMYQNIGGFTEVIVQ